MRTLNVGASRRHKYAALLALLLVSLAIQSFDARSGAEGILSDALRTMMAVAILIVVFDRQRERMAMAVIVAASIARVHRRINLDLIPFSRMLFQTYFCPLRLW